MKNKNSDVRFGRTFMNISDDTKQITINSDLSSTEEKLLRGESREIERLCKEGYKVLQTPTPNRPKSF